MVIGVRLASLAISRSLQMDAFIQGALDTEVRPKRTANDALILRDGQRYRTLVDASGQRTAAGRKYEQLANTTLPVEGYDASQQPVRQGNAEIIRVRGREKVVRRYDPASNDWVYTKLGRQFYNQRQVQWVIKVPAVFSGTRSNGNPYTRRGYFPVEAPIALPQALSGAQRDQRIRARVNELYPEGILAEYSEERITINQQGAWQISEMTTTPSADGPRVSVADRPLGARPSMSGMLFPEALCAAAFEDVADKMCVPRQIAQVLGISFDQVVDELDECELAVYGTDVWRERGASAKMIFEYAKRHDLGACVIHGERVIETLPGRTPLVFAVHESHAYFYADKRVRKALASRIAHSHEQMKREAMHSQTPAAEEWEPWTGELRPGHLRVLEDQSACGAACGLEQVRCALLATGRHPKVMLKDEARIRSLQYKFVAALDGHKGCCTIHALPPEAPEISAWLRNLGLGIPYRGEGLPNITYKVLLVLLRRKERMYLHGYEKHELLEQAEYQCALCGERDAFEWDHVIPLSTSFGEQLFQPVCCACHGQKSHEEPRELEQDVLASHFNQRVWDSYVLSERPPPLVHKAREVESAAGLTIADVKRCRKRALEHNAHDVPIFSPLDDVQKVSDYTLGDINFVTCPARDCVAQLGYCGPGWQHRTQTEWLLYTGTITWADIPWKLTARGRLPKDVFARPLQIMESAWEDGLGKQAINSMIGLWCRDEVYSYKLTTSNHPDDVLPNSLRRTMHYDGGFVIDYITKTRIVSTTSLRPLHDLCMCTEAVRVGQMLYCLRKSRAPVYEIKTDSVLYRLSRSRDVLDPMTFEDVARVREVFEGPNQRRLNQYHTPAAQTSKEKVFRVQNAVEKDLMLMNPQHPRRQVSYTPPDLTWRDVTEEEAERIVVNGGSLLVLGVAGCGKTFLCSKLVEALRALGKRVDVIAKTHTAAVRAKGDTADFDVRRRVLRGACTADVLHVDEVFQVDCVLWSQLNKIKGRQWLLSGDQHQFPPLFNTWKGAEVPEDALWNSSLLHTLAGGNRLVLTECKRSSHELFDWYSSLIPGGARFEAPLPQVLAEARATFRFEGPARHNLCISHRARIKLNAQCNRHFAEGQPSVFVRAKAEKGQLCAAQSMLIWPGIELLGCSRSSRKIRNNVLYTVRQLTEDLVYLSAPHTEELLALQYAQVAELLRLPYAQTYASCQGTEFASSLRLHDTESRHFTRRHLFVATSRAQRVEQIDIAQ